MLQLVCSIVQGFHNIITTYIVESLNIEIHYKLAFSEDIKYMIITVWRVVNSYIYINIGLLAISQ